MDEDEKKLEKSFGHDSPKVAATTFLSSAEADGEEKKSVDCSVELE